jgi:hypothetical protein
MSKAITSPKGIVRRGAKKQAAERPPAKPVTVPDEFKWLDSVKTAPEGQKEEWNRHVASGLFTPVARANASDRKLPSLQPSGLLDPIRAAQFEANVAQMLRDRGYTLVQHCPPPGRDYARVPNPKGVICAWHFHGECKGYEPVYVVFAGRVGTGMRLERAPSKHVIVVCDLPSKSVSSKSAFPATPSYLVPTPQLLPEEKEAKWPREGLTMQTSGVKVECIDTGLIDIWQNDLFMGWTLRVTNDIKGVMSKYMLANMGHAPRRLAMDRLVQYFGLEAGTVFLLTRPSSTAGYTTEPRLVVEQEGPAGSRKAEDKLYTPKRAFIANRPI